MGHHNDGNALGLQVGQNLCEGLLEKTVDALGGLVQQKKPGLGEQHLGKGGSLLLAAGQVIRMAAEKGFNLAQPGNFGNGGSILRHFLQFLPDGFLYKQAFGILGQHGKTAPEQLGRFVFFHGLSEEGDFAPVGTTDTGNGLQGGGFAGAVAAQDGVEASGGNLRTDSTENVRGILFIPEPELFEHQRRIFHFLGKCRSGNGILFGGFRKFPAEPASPLTNRQGAFSAAPGSVEYPHRGGHGGEHGVIPGKEQLTHPAGGVVRQNSAIVHDHCPVGIGEDVFQPVLGDEHGGAQLRVDFPDGIQKIRGGDGV